MDASTPTPADAPRTSLPPARRAVAVSITVLVLLTAAACAGGPDAGRSRSTHPSAGTSAHGSAFPIAVTYEAHGRSSEGAYRYHAQLVEAGAHHVRLTMSSTGFPPMLFVYDGHRLLVHDSEVDHAWSLYEAPAEHPDELEAVVQMSAVPGSPEFARQCPSATVVGHRHLLGRAAVGYHCATRHFSDGYSESVGLEWLDEETGVLLQLGPLRAVAVDLHPRVTAATFSTRPPTGAQVAVYARRARPGAPPTRAPGFALQRVMGHGTVSLSGYAHEPLVLAFFVSDLVFDPTGETCHGCLDSLLALQRLTDGGTDPAVLAVQEGEVGKPGDPLVPRGLHVDVVNDPGADVQHSYGLSEQVGFAFIDSHGMVRQAFDGAPTDRELGDALAALR